MQSLTAQVIVDIINQEMSMPENTVWVRDETRLIPNDENLYIVVGLVYSDALSNITFMETKTVNGKTVATQISQVIMREELQIDVFSRTNEARERAWEVVAAMQSFYSQQLQEKNNFKIFRNQTGFVNSSEAEGGSFINRYSISIPAHVWYRKEKQLNSPLGDYYNDFNTRVDDEQTIGTDKPIAEFEITPETPPPL